MNDLLKELSELDGQIKALEQEAIKHEELARGCRARRGELKLRQSELNSNINDAKLVHAAQGSLAAAQASEKAAAEYKDEVKNELDVLRTRLEGLTVKEDKLDELIKANELKE